MKFLQTGDWHLGKVFYETSLIEDQKHFLSEITDELARAQNDGSPYDALVVPGDVYDRAVPPAEAVSLLSGFLASAHEQFPSLHILLLSGNHDSAARLGFGAELFSRANIHICSDTSSFTEPVIINNAAFYQLPFLTPGSISRSNDTHSELFDAPLRTQNELYSEACARIAAAHKKKHGDMPAILCAHAYVLGSENPEIGNASVGTAELVDAQFFSPFAYTAFGHVHKCQKLGKDGRAYYSGSPLAYNFNDAPQKYMLAVTIGKEISVEKIPFHPLHPVVRKTGTFSEFYEAKITPELAQSFIEFQCTDNTAVENPMALLRQKYPHILSFTHTHEGTESADTAFEERRRVLAESGEKSPADVFDLFIKDLYGTAANAPTDSGGSTAASSTQSLIADERSIFISLCKKTEEE